MNPILLKLLAYQAIAKAEAAAVKVLVSTGQKLLSQQKEDQAVAAVVAEYRNLTADVPVLKDTLLDDALVEAKARQFIHWAFVEGGDLINRVTATPVVTAPGLPASGAR